MGRGSDYIFSGGLKINQLLNATGYSYLGKKSIIKEVRALAKS